jgi:hypothetical protein
MELLPTHVLESRFHYFLSENYRSSLHLFEVLKDKGLGSTNAFFKWCCDCIGYYGEVCGMTYEEMNIFLFVILQPLLILTFGVLYFRTRSKLKAMQSKMRSSGR